VNGTRTCSIPDCQSTIKARGWCVKHWTRWARYGDPLGAAAPQEAAVRFMRKVDKSGNCWIWMAAKNEKGYGKFSVGRSMKRAHRFSWEMVNGPIPAGALLDHRCHNRACVNPDHLRLATASQNQENRSGAQRTNATGIRGVSWYPPMRKWRARIRDEHLGYFDSIEEAASTAMAARNAAFTHNDKDR